MSIDVHALRSREFPWAERGDTIFLNAASTGPLPQRAVEALTEWARLRATPHKLRDEIQFGTLAKGRELIARLIGAKPAEIALAVNTSFGINLAAFALPLSPGDVILTPDLEFPANVYPWMAAARARGLEYRRLPLTDGLLDEDRLLQELDDHSVKCLSVSWVGFANGYRVDLERLGKVCRARGIYFVVDAIQGLGPLTLDVSRLDVDILACGGQKWLLSPWGSGFVYVRDELARSMDPPIVSWMSAQGTDDFRKLTDYDPRWRPDARRFEFITVPYQDFAGMNASLELFMELTPSAMAAHITRLADEIVQWSEANRVALVTPSDGAKRAGTVSIRPAEGVAVSERLRSAGVVHSFREGAIRLAPHVYNTSEDIQAALQIIARA
ncbi:MAG: aminotransferase class V-fold PLP-dependent enzyme [Gemmatimonadaceae bacterium]